MCGASSALCGTTLLDSELPANDYLTLSIRQDPIDEKNQSPDHVPAHYVSVVEQAVSGDTWVTAKRLMDQFNEFGKEASEKTAEAS